MLQFFRQAVLRLQDTGDDQQGGLNARGAKRQCRALVPPFPTASPSSRPWTEPCLACPFPFALRGCFSTPDPRRCLCRSQHVRAAQSPNPNPNPK